MSALIAAVQNWRNGDSSDSSVASLIGELRRVVDEHSPNAQYLEAIDRFADLHSLEVRIYERSKDQRDWRYKSLEFGGDSFAYFVAVPDRKLKEECSNAEQAPPTAAVETLIFAILHDPEMFSNDLRESCVVVVSSVARLSMDPSDFSWIASSLGGTQRKNLPRDFWLSDKAQLTAIPQKFQDGRLTFKVLINAYSAPQVEYRFLSFYRVLEAKLRRNILERIQSEFLLDPSSTLSSATKLLEAERKQLCAVVEKYCLEIYFEEIVEAWKILKQNNSFANLIERKCSRDFSSGGVNSKYEKGVTIVYQCRCAIVHTADGIVYEQFDDADQAIETIVPFIEQAVLSCIGVQPID